MSSWTSGWATPHQWIASRAKCSSASPMRSLRSGRMRSAPPPGRPGRCRSSRLVPIRFQPGFAAGLARPGGNVTGVVILAEELDGKRLDLLTEAVPGVRRVGALLQRSLPYRQQIERYLRTISAIRGIELPYIRSRRPRRLSGDVCGDAQRRDAGTGDNRQSYVQSFSAGLLARLSLEMRLPIICESAENARSGCLLGYGPNRGEMRRRLAHHVARIFQGARPAELPIETPNAFRTCDQP